MNICGVCHFRAESFKAVKDAIIRAREIIDKGLWDKFCELRGLNPWCINEGQMRSDEEFTFEMDENQVIELR